MSKIAVITTKCRESLFFHMLRKTSPGARDTRGTFPLLLYTALSIFFFGRSLISHPSERYIGNGADPSQFMWYLRWWPYAIAHRLNPFLPRVIWPPTGVNLAWSASIPLPSVAAYPLTSTLGIVPTFNLLCLACPALAGWAAFLVCRYVSRSYWPAVFGGFIFAFSSHMLGKTFGNLNDALVFPVPLVLYTALLWKDRRIGTNLFVALLSSLLVVEFLSFIETFATMSLFGALALILAIVLSGGEQRRRLIEMALPVTLSYVLAFVVVSPYIYFLIAYPLRTAEIMPTAAFSIDPVNFFIPTSLNELGRLPFFAHIASSYTGGLMESGGYLAPPLIAIAILFARDYWRETHRRLMVQLLIIFLVFSMGPRLHVLTTLTPVSLPWAPFTYSPFIKKALPARFMLYAFLDLAIMASLWIRQLEYSAALKSSFTAATILFMLPNLSPTYWTVSADIPKFFSSREYRHYLSPGEIVIILPYSIGGDVMLWQATSNMYFKMVQGWTGFPLIPKQFENWPIVDALIGNTNIPDVERQVGAFLADSNVGAVIVAKDCFCAWQYRPGPSAAPSWSRAHISNNDSRLWSTWFRNLNVAPIDAGGILLYKGPFSNLARYRGSDQLELNAALQLARLNALISAAAQYLKTGRDLHDLSPIQAVKLGLLPGDWVSSDFQSPNQAKAPMASDLLLDADDTGNISVGVVGPYRSLRPLVETYGLKASAVDYLSMDVPHVIVKHLERVDVPFLLILTFDRSAIISEGIDIQRISEGPGAH
jgi:hypothetical protein